MRNERSEMKIRKKRRSDKKTSTAALCCFNAGAALAAPCFFQGAAQIVKDERGRPIGVTDEYAQSGPKLY